MKGEGDDVRYRMGRWEADAGAVVFWFPEGLSLVDLDELDEFWAIQMRSFRRAASSAGSTDADPEEKP